LLITTPFHFYTFEFNKQDITRAETSLIQKNAQQYELVQHISGKPRRAYALNNDQEYFAECTEAIFGTNDFYPFVRSELKQHDQQMYELLRKLWKIE